MSVTSLNRTEAADVTRCQNVKSAQSFFLPHLNNAVEVELLLDITIRVCKARVFQNIACSVCKKARALRAVYVLCELFPQRGQVVWLLLCWGELNLPSLV